MEGVGSKDFLPGYGAARASETVVVRGYWKAMVHNDSISLFLLPLHQICYQRGGCLGERKSLE